MEPPMKKYIIQTVNGCKERYIYYINNNTNDINFVYKKNNRSRTFSNTGFH